MSPSVAPRATRFVKWWHQLVAAPAFVVISMLLLLLLLLRFSHLPCLMQNPDVMWYNPDGLRTAMTASHGALCAR